jgi:hypothetical protein
MAHVILFQHDYYFGAHKHVFDAEPRLEKSPHGDEDDPSLDKEDIVHDHS